MTTRSDNFNRADVTPLDGNWSSLGAQPVRIITGGGGEQALQHTSANQLAQYRYTLDLATSDHYTQMKFDFLQTPTGNTAFFEVTARGNASDRTCYVGGYSITTGGSVTAYLGRRNSSGTLTSLDSGSSTIATNDTIRLEVVGTSLTLKKNGTTIRGPVTDATITTGVRPGFVYLAGNEAYDFEADDFDAADIAAANISIPVAQRHYRQRRD